MPATVSCAASHQQELILPFEQEVREVLHRLRSAVSALIGAVDTGAGDSIQRATDLQRALNIRSTLAWRIYRFAHAEDPVQEAMTLPGPTAMSRFFDAARKRGIAEPTVHAAESAMHSFDAMVKRYAGTRAAFDSMLSDLAGDAGQAIELVHRRAAYNANSHIWGVQVRTRFTSMLYYRGGETLIDMAHIHGVVDLRQIRANRPFVLARSHVEQTPGARLGQPIDPESHERYGVSILPEFCSAPTPRIETHTDSNGELVAELLPSAMGKRGAVSAVVASLYKGLGYRFKTPQVPTVTTFGRIDTPYEICLADILIEEGAYGILPQEVEARIIGRYLTGNIDNLRDLDQQALWRQGAAYLGRGTSTLATTHVPRYPELIEYVAQRVGVDAQRLHAYRCRVEYPVMPSVIALGFSIPLTREQLRDGAEP